MPSDAISVHDGELRVMVVSPPLMLPTPASHAMRTASSGGRQSPDHCTIRTRLSGGASLALM